MITTQTAAGSDRAMYDLAALKQACDALTGACGVRLWTLARRIAEFARAHTMSGSDVARGLGRSRGYVSRALAAARLPEPKTDADAQRVFEAFHGVKSAARRVKDSATAIRHAKTWARTAVRRGARREAVKLAIDNAIADVVPQDNTEVFRHVETSATPANTSRNVSTCRNIGSTAIMTVALAMLCAWTQPVTAQGLPCRYSVTVLPEIDCGLFTSPGSPVAINNLGEVLLIGHCGDHEQTYLWTGGGALQQIALPRGVLGFRASDLNDHGIIAGTAVTTTAGQRGFLYNRNSGQWTPIAPLNPPSGWSGVARVTNNGQACGFQSIGSKGDPVNPQSAFRWNGNLATLGLIGGGGTWGADVNEQGTVSISTGFSVDPGSLAYLWHANGTLEPIGPVPGGVTSQSGAMNNRNWVVVDGMIQADPLMTRAFIRKPDGSFTEMPSLPGAFSSGLLSITDSGVVAGHANYDGPNFTTRACVWRNAHPIDLNSLVADFDGILWSAIMAADERIVAFGADERDDAAVFLLTPVYAIEGDTNCDWVVDVDDLVSVILTWGSCAGCNADITRDGTVDVFDLIAVIVHWGQSGGAS